ncbi:MAG: riboflavin biosynthesis protein RibF [Eubacteriales bacterium]
MLISTVTGQQVDKIPEKGFALALGCFDGLHVGHAALFRSLLSHAGESRLCAAAWTFAPPRDGGLCPVKRKPRLISFQEKLERLAALGVYYAFVYEFSDVADLSPEKFVSEILLRECSCRLAVCGYNFTFGAHAAGNAQCLSALLADAGAATVVVPPVAVNGKTVSSAAIRAALAAGDTETVAAMLGRPYTITSTVVTGQHLGTALGFPTVNQSFFEGAALPRFGVYAGRTDVGGSFFPSVTNVGVRPTVSQTDIPNAETHLLGFSGNLYGAVVRVSLERFLREEHRFSSEEELAAAVRADIAEAYRTETTRQEKENAEGGKQA